MNVWTHPEVPSPSSNRDVLVYFHGGGLMTGSGHEIGESFTQSEFFWLSVWFALTLIVSIDGLFQVWNLFRFNGHVFFSESLPTSELLRDSKAIIVSFNYRLNAFGFLSLETLTAVDGFNASGNYGLMDQILVLHWVQQNIRLFGGNPNSVSICLMVK